MLLWVNTASYSDLVLSDTKPLPDPKLTQIYSEIVEAKSMEHSSTKF